MARLFLVLFSLIERYEINLFDEKIAGALKIYRRRLKKSGLRYLRPRPFTVEESAKDIKSVTTKTPILSWDKTKNQSKTLQVVMIHLFTRPRIKAIFLIFHYADHEKNEREEKIKKALNKNYDEIILEYYASIPQRDYESS